MEAVEEEYRQPRANHSANKRREDDRHHLLLRPVPAPCFICDQREDGEEGKKKKDAVGVDANPIDLEKDRPH